MPGAEAAYAEYRACFEEYLAGTRPWPWGQGRALELDGEPVLVHLELDGDWLRFCALLVPSVARGKGLGRRALAWVLELAQRHGVRLYGQVERFGSAPNGLKQRQLREWYKRHGFRVYQNGMIEWRPLTQSLNGRKVAPCLRTIKPKVSRSSMNTSSCASPANHPLQP